MGINILKHGGPLFNIRHIILVDVDASEIFSVPEYLDNFRRHFIYWENSIWSLFRISQLKERMRMWNCGLTFPAKVIPLTYRAHVAVTNDWTPTTPATKFSFVNHFSLLLFKAFLPHHFPCWYILHVILSDGIHQFINRRIVFYLQRCLYNRNLSERKPIYYFSVLTCEVIIIMGKFMVFSLHQFNEMLCHL